MIWREFFGLDEEAGLKDLRRAYSRKIKTCRPEDDQEHFMEIRRLYEQGCAYFENADRRPSFSMDDVDELEDSAGNEDEYIDEENHENGEEAIEYDEENTINTETFNAEESIEYDEGNTINMEIFNGGDEGASRRVYEESSTLRFDIEGQEEEYEYGRNPYQTCYEKLHDLYSDFNSRFNPESWRKLLFSLNFDEEDVFEAVFQEFIGDNFALTKEAVEIIRERGFVFSKACDEMLDMIEGSDFAYRGYPDLAYDEREDFFKLRMRIYSWLLGYDERISKRRIERVCHLAVRNDRTLRIFLYYMLQNGMDDLIEKCLEGVSKEDAVEKGFLAFSAQMDFEKGDNSSSFEKYRRVMESHKDELRYEIGAFASGSALRYAGEEVEVPYQSSQCVFKIFSKKRKKLERMKSRGMKKSIKGDFLSTIIAILLGMAAFVVFGTGAIMLLLITFSPAERLGSLGRFGTYVAFIMRSIIAVGLLTGIGRWIRGKKGKKQD